MVVGVALAALDSDFRKDGGGVGLGVLMLWGRLGKRAFQKAGYSASAVSSSVGAVRGRTCLPVMRL